MLRLLGRKDYLDLKCHRGRKQNIAVRFALLGIVALQLCLCQAGKVIVLTTPLGVSHIVNLRKIAEELAQQRGHQIIVSPLSLLLRSRQYASVSPSNSSLDRSLLMVTTFICSAVCRYEPRHRSLAAYQQQSIVLQHSWHD